MVDEIPDTPAMRRQIDAAVGALALGDPGAGHTAERWTELAEAARSLDTSVARLVEAHVDAVAILHEADTEPSPGALYGVWASVGPGGATVDLDDDGRLTGAKAFCSGLGIVDRALIDVRAGERRQLVEVDVRAASSLHHGDPWGVPAMRATRTGSIQADTHPVVRLVGPPGWYLERVGFWHGACGPAACWAGSTMALLDHLGVTDRETTNARIGRMLVERVVTDAVLVRAGHRIDDEPTRSDVARHVALATRAAVHDACLRFLREFVSVVGPRGLTDPAIARRVDDVTLYLRQFHVDGDPAALARTALDRIADE